MKSTTRDCEFEFPIYCGAGSEFVLLALAPPTNN